MVLDRLMLAVNLRSACDISLACRPICESPIVPSISAFGTSAATESTTRTSNLQLLINDSVISSACSPLSGCEINKFCVSTPIFSAYTGSSACSTSIKAAFPPLFCASAIICNVSVVFPDDSGPYTSTILPFGTPPIPVAVFNPKDPVALNLFTQKDLLDAIEKAERRIKREKKQKEKDKQKSLSQTNE